MSGSPAIELRGLTRDFAIGLRGVKLRAVDDLTLSVAAGEIFGLLGPNGSGKSTTIKILLGLMPPTAGACSVFGVPGDRIEARLAIGYLPEAPDFYRTLTGRELVRFYGGLCGLPRASLAARVADTIESVGLTEAADRRVGTYSKGMLQRIGLAQALVHDPKLLILDEPTAGVDPVGAAAMGELFLRLKARGKTIFITSHLLGQMEDWCDRIAILDRGRLILEGTVRELTGGPERPALTIGALPPAELAELQAWLAARGRGAATIAPPRPRLDRIFIERVGEHSRRRP